MDLNFFKHIFGEKMVADLEAQLKQVKESWEGHLSQDEKEHKAILDAIEALNKKIDKIVKE